MRKQIIYEAAHGLRGCVGETFVMAYCAFTMIHLFNCKEGEAGGFGANTRDVQLQV